MFRCNKRGVYNEDIFESLGQLACFPVEEMAPDSPSSSTKEGQLICWKRFLRGFSGASNTVFNVKEGACMKKNCSNVWSMKYCSPTQDLKEAAKEFFLWACISEENCQAFIREFLPEVSYVFKEWKGRPPVALEVVLEQLLQTEIEPGKCYTCPIRHAVYKELKHVCKGDSERFLKFLNLRTARKPDCIEAMNCEEVQQSTSRKRPYTRAVRKFSNEWYGQFEEEDLLIEAAKLGLKRANLGICHRDVLSAVHRPHHKNQSKEMVFRYLLTNGRGFQNSNESSDGEGEPVMKKKLLKEGETVSTWSDEGEKVEKLERIMQILDKIKHVDKDRVEEVRALIEENKWITKNHVHTSWYRIPEVLGSLLRRVNFLELLRWLPSFTVNSSIGCQAKNLNLIHLNKSIIVERLKSGEELNFVQPEEVLICWKLYDDELGYMKKANKKCERYNYPLSFNRDPDISKALSEAYHNSLKCVKSSGKKIVFCTQIDTTLFDSKVVMLHYLTGQDVIAALMIRALKVEKGAVFLGFSGPKSNVVPLPLKENDDFEKVKKKIRQLQNCLLVKTEKLFEWAQKQNETVDVFVMILRMKKGGVDQFGKDKWKVLKEAFSNYRRNFNPEAKLILLLLLQPREEKCPQGMSGLVSFSGFNRFAAEIVWRMARGEKGYEF